tara:strand:+ start:22 stop:432 length:411 start_codon:yes stop_codon:yes gene_type:complete
MSQRNPTMTSEQERTLEHYIWPKDYDHLGDFSESQYVWFTEQLAHLAVDHMSESQARCVAMEHMIITFRGQQYAFQPTPQNELFKEVLELFGGPSVLKKMLDEMPNDWNELQEWERKHRWKGETWTENYEMSPFTR